MSKTASTLYSELLQIAAGNDTVKEQRFKDFSSYVRNEVQYKTTAGAKDGYAASGGKTAPHSKKAK